MSSEIVNVVVAFAVVFLVVRWFTGKNDDTSNGQRSPAAILGFRPRNVTDEMVNTVHAMFPDMPVDNIRYDLLRTGSPEVTTNKILEKGYLEAPPQSYFQLYPRTEAAPPPPTTSATSSAKSTGVNKSNSLISRFKLQERLKESEANEELLESDSNGLGGSTKGVWETTAQAREKSLQERKAKMILAARQRLLKQDQMEAKGKGKATDSQSPVASGSGSS